MKQQIQNKLLIDGLILEQIRLALVNEANELLEYHDIKNTGSLINNIYLGKIDDVQPALDAAFVRFDSDKLGFLSLSDVHSGYFGKHSKRLKKGQSVMVQVIKDPTKGKSYTLTTYITITGTNCVYLPYDSDNSGISKKITGKNREKLKEFLEQLNLKGSLIIRTASNDAQISEIKDEFRKIMQFWNQIIQKAEQKQSPGLLHQEDTLLKILRGYSNQSVESVVITNATIHEKIKKYIASGTLKFPEKIELQNKNIFEKIESQIQELYRHELKLPSGGSIVIEHTEALTAIDVNSKKSRMNNMETTAFNTNKEAIEMAIKQIILRNLGGLIVIDCIDMANEEHIKHLNKLIKDLFKNDRAAVKIIGYSDFGLVQISRQRLNSSIMQRDFEKCDACTSGFKLKHNIIALNFIREIKTYKKSDHLKIFITTEILEKIMNNFAGIILQYKYLNWKIVLQINEQKIEKIE